MGETDTIVITGDEAQKAFNQLQNSTSLQLTRDQETGKISATGEAITKGDKQLLNAINDSKIAANIEAIKEDFVMYEGNKYYFIGGAFMGNKIMEHSFPMYQDYAIEGGEQFGIEWETINTVKTFQVVNPNHMDIIDTYFNVPGKSMLHESTETYEGGIISLEKGVSASPAINGNKNLIYNLSHSKATGQPGGDESIYTQYIDAQNNETDKYNATHQRFFIKSGTNPNQPTIYLRPMR
jgi:hypothetical protein